MFLYVYSCVLPALSAVPQSNDKGCKYLIVKRETKRRQHLYCEEAAVKVTYCGVPVGYEVAVDWLTRAMMSVPTRNEAISVLSVLQKKKTTKYKREDAQGGVSQECL